MIEKRCVLSLIELRVKHVLKDNRQFLQALDEFTVHNACKRRYTVRSNVAASVRRGDNSVSEPSSLRSSRGSMQLQNSCFLCGLSK